MCKPSKDLLALFPDLLPLQFACILPKWSQGRPGNKAKEICCEHHTFELLQHSPVWNCISCFTVAKNTVEISCQLSKPLVSGIQ